MALIFTYFSFLLEIIEKFWNLEIKYNSYIIYVVQSKSAQQRERFTTFIIIQRVKAIIQRTLRTNKL